MAQKTCLEMLVYLTVLLLNVKMHSAITFINPIRFPNGRPYMGLALALALPLELNNDVFLSFNIESVYLLPKSNETSYTYPPIIAKRSIDRRGLYAVLEQKLDRHGLIGRPCLLRAICEASEYSLDKGGVLGDLFHILLTPSSSGKEEGFDPSYHKAEEYGRTKKHCRRYRKSCPTSALDSMTTLKHPHELFNSYLS